MANTTSAIEPGTITIEIESGAVTAVRGLPDDCQYEIVVHDSKCITREEPERKALYLATVNILVRATSPERAADAIYRAMTGLGVVDWDYAVQDRVRQYPRCVCLDLEPENIAELLDYIAA